MKNIFTVLFCAVAFQSYSQAPGYPFPHHATYTLGTIKPDNYSQNTLDKQVKTFYDKWRLRYVLPGCTSGEYYIWYNDNGGNGNNICVSEGQGYGMVITALMAGYDPNAKIYFDGLYYWFKSHPSSVNPMLMNWRQKNPGCVSNGDDSATDGDMDIAYGLLLADKQWGSNGAINYLQEATNIINAIKQSEVYAIVHSTQLGDWSHTDNFYKDGTRPSDFMCDHFRAYQHATNDATWNNVMDECYDLISDMQTNYSAATGLIPDFIQDTDGNPVPAQPNYLEGPYDGNYDYNACRVPWRLATDYAVNGDARAKTACDKINSWIRTKTGNNVSKIRSGYYLNGNNLPGNNYQDLSFIAPFAVSAMTDATNQTWLNNLWNNIKGVNINRDGYYGNTIKMQAMIVLSGNWWSPQNVLKSSTVETSTNESINQNDFTIYPNPSSNNCTVSFKLKEASDVEVNVFNNIGQIVYSKKLILLGEGFHSSSIDVSNFEEGMYHVIMQAGVIRRIGTMMVVK